MGEIAERWYELGKPDKAKALFAEALKIATELTDKTDFNRGMFAARLALVDLSSAELIARDYKGDPSEGRILGNMAFHLAAQKPADCERLWQQTARMSRPSAMSTVLSWKLATVDPARAVRVVSALSKSTPRPELELYVALGAKARDQSISRQAVQTALQGLDKLMEERPERFAGVAADVLWLVEQIDPALVPEVCWRLVASRSPYGNPRADHADGPTVRVSELAVYDRDVAAALFQPTLARMEQTDPNELASWGYEFMCWSLIDPRAAVARLEKIPVASIPDYRKGNIAARMAVARLLARSSQERWRNGIADEREIIFGGKRGF
jgi:hypothetical protein